MTLQSFEHFQINAALVWCLCLEISIFSLTVLHTFSPILRCILTYAFKQSYLALRVATECPKSKIHMLPDLVRSRFQWTGTFVFLGLQKV